MIDITSDIQSLTTFRRRSGDFIKQLKKTKLGGGVLNDSSGFPLYGQDHTPGSRILPGVRSRAGDTSLMFPSVLSGTLHISINRSMPTISGRARVVSRSAPRYPDARRTASPVAGHRRKSQTTSNLYGNKPHIYRAIYRVLERQKQVDVVHIRHGARDDF